MNAHELARLIETFEELDLEDFKKCEDGDFDAIAEEIVGALRELEARRRAARDEHGCEVPA